MAIVAPLPHHKPPKRDTPFLSSGRGGSGNIRRLKTTQDSRLTLDTDAISIRSRERVPPSPKRFAVSSGRGGSGNIRPPSPNLETHPLTAAILSKHVATQAQYAQQIRQIRAESKVLHSSGRGGSGNISDPRRSRSTGPPASKRAKERVKSGASTSANVQAYDRNEPHSVGVARSERFSTLTSSSGTELSQCAGSSRSSVKTSGSGVAEGSSGLSSYSAESWPGDDASRSKKKRGFLTRWNKPQNRGAPIESIKLDLLEGEAEAEAPECSSPQLQDLQYERANGLSPTPSSVPPQASFTTLPTYSSPGRGTHSNRSNQPSTLSLPIVAEDREYVSFLEF
ncbi:hypothetical protein BU15DRAFT_77087 [Melanogaster broomeanus]|nr:hypothetical protein BU15DRAFT_77087 [Melanogaster broomeanus]